MEEVKSEGGLDGQINYILELCKNNGVPVVFALNRYVENNILFIYCCGCCCDCDWCCCSSVVAVAIVVLWLW